MDSDGSHIIVGSIICGLLTAARAFFTCCEAACTEISDAKVRSYEHERGAKGALFALLSRPVRLRNAFAAHRIVNAFLLTLAVSGTFFSHIDKLLPFYAAGYAAKAAVLLAAVIIVTALADDLPKRLIREKGADGFAVFCARAVRLLTIVMLPVTAISEAIAGAVCAVTGRGTQASGDTVTEEEILLMVDAGNETGAIEQSEREMINNVFEFHETTVGDIMTHRIDIVAADIDSEISEIVYAAINSGFSRIPVYSGSIDHIEGIIYVKDLLCLIGTQSADEMTVRSFLRDALFVPESCMCDDLFRMLTSKRQQLAIAVDEYGGTAGLVTMEDLVEAIVGNIQDEYDNEAEDITLISDGTYTVSGSADAADIMEILGCPLPEDRSFDTMGGFITDLLGRIPEEGETPSVRYADIIFSVLLVEDMRIVRIKAVVNRDNDEKEQQKE